MGGYDRDAPLGPRRILTVEEAQRQAQALVDHALTEHPARVRQPWAPTPVAPEPLGYLILTRQPDDTWRDDWDGLVHETHQSAVEELRAARRRQGHDNARIAVLYPLEEE